MILRRVGHRTSCSIWEARSRAPRRATRWRTSFHPSPSGEGPGVGARVLTPRRPTAPTPTPPLKGRGLIAPRTQILLPPLPTSTSAPAPPSPPLSSPPPATPAPSIFPPPRASNQTDEATRQKQ